MQYWGILIWNTSRAEKHCTEHKGYLLWLRYEYIHVHGCVCLVFLHKDSFFHHWCWTSQSFRHSCRDLGTMCVPDAQVLWHMASDRVCLEETESSMGGTENKWRMTKRPRKFQQAAVIAECVFMCVSECDSGAQRDCVGQSRLECLEWQKPQCPL